MHDTRRRRARGARAEASKYVTAAQRPADEEHARAQPRSEPDFPPLSLSGESRIPQSLRHRPTQASHPITSGAKNGGSDTLERTPKDSYRWLQAVLAARGT